MNKEIHQLQRGRRDPPRRVARKVKITKRTHFPPLMRSKKRVIPECRCRESSISPLPSEERPGSIFFFPSPFGGGARGGVSGEGGQGWGSFNGKSEKIKMLNIAKRTHSAVILSLSKGGGRYNVLSGVPTRQLCRFYAAVR